MNMNLNSLRNGRNAAEVLDRPIVVGKRESVPKQMNLNLPLYKVED